MQKLRLFTVQAILNTDKNIAEPQEVLKLKVCPNFYYAFFQVLISLEFIIWIELLCVNGK